MLKASMDKSLVKFKDTRSVSNNEVDLLCKIPGMLHQQQCWKFASVRRNFGAPSFRKLMSKCSMYHILKLGSGFITRRNVWAVSGL